MFAPEAFGWTPPGPLMCLLALKRIAQMHTRYLFDLAHYLHGTISKALLAPHYLHRSGGEPLAIRYF